MSSADETLPLPLGPPSAPLSPKRHRIYPLLTLLLLIHLSIALYTLPFNRVIELRLCREHYAKLHDPAVPADGDIPEHLCKIDEVQRGLAWLQGIMATTFIVLDFMVTIPFSFITERYGIKVVLWVTLIPRFGLNIWAVVVGRFDHLLPTKAILAGPFLGIFGAECVFQSTIFTLASALAKDYVERASYFSYINSTSYVVSFLGPTLAAFIMSQNLWLPFFINIILLSFAVFTIKFLTGHEESRPATLVSDDAQLAAEEAEPLLHDIENSPRNVSNAFEASPTFTQSLLLAVQKLQKLITGRRNFQVLLVSFFLTALASSDTKLLVQYISVRYKWTFAQAGYMLSAKALVNFILLAIVVPRIIRASRSSKTVHDDEVRLDYLGAEISIIVSVVGVLIVGFALDIWMLLAALVVYALGSALPVFTMSLVKSPIVAVANSDAQDFSIVMMTKALGSLVGAPLMTVLWVHGINLGGLGLGLPYFVSASIYVAAAIVITRLKT